MSRITPFLARTLNRMEIPTQRQTPNSRTQKDRQRKRINQCLRSRRQQLDFRQSARVCGFLKNCFGGVECGAGPCGEVAEGEVDACDMC
jgi:hypothetical protein